MQTLGKTLVLIIVSLFSLTSYAFYDLQGHKMQLQNKWVIVNYWADWCESCVAEVPELNKFYKDNLDKDVMIVGVNYDQLPVNSLRMSVNRVGITFPVITQDPNDTWNLGDIPVIPMTFIINPQGKVVDKIVGPSSEARLKAAICSKATSTSLCG